MPYPTERVISNEIEFVVKDSEFKPGLQRARLSEDRLRELIIAQSEQLVSTVSMLISDYNTLEKTLADIKSNNAEMFLARDLLHKNEFPDNNWLTFVEILAILSITVTPLFSSWGHQLSLGLIYDLVGNIWLKIVLVVIVSVLLFILAYWGVGKLRNFYLARYYTRFFNSFNPSVLQSYEAALERLGNLNKQIIQNLRDKGIKDMVRGLINSQLQLSYTTCFEDFSATGLGEVINADNTINTNAKDKLSFLLNSMPGGAIGVAGSRGAGKSTLIQSYCGRDRSETRIRQTPAIAVLAVAPVKYDARDFILHLFKTTCLSVLREEAGDESVDVEKLTNEEAIEESIIKQKTIIRLIRPLLTVVSFVLIYAGGLRHFVNQEHEINVSAPITASQLDSVRANMGKSNIHPDSSKSEHPKVDTMISKSDSPRNLDRIFGVLIPSAETGAKFLVWGLGILLLVLFSLFYERSVFKMLFASEKERVAQRLHNEGIRKRNALKRTLEERPNLKAAITWLKKIKFQQSFTTGWSGSLKLPFALEGGVNKAMTFAERQMSYPDIIAAYREYLIVLQLTYPVIIGIDELDKLESDEVAQEFLNEIKSIFGIQNVFFLISISENAMSNFERRGMPFRDVFDSTFDSVVFVDNFTLKDATTLLQRRVIGNPMSFFCLAYCFAGGLPRDIIRYFREIVRISTCNKTIEEITDQLTSDDVAAKLRAIIHSVKQFSDKADNQELLNIFFQLSESVVTLSSLKFTIHQLYAHQIALKTKLDQLQALTSEKQDREVVELLKKNRKINYEFHAYLCYMTTLMDIFTIAVDQHKIKRIEENGVFNILAKARQALSVDHLLALERINQCRLKENLPAFG